MLLKINRFAVGSQSGSFGIIKIDGTLFSQTLEPVVPVVPITLLSAPWPVLPVWSPTQSPKLQALGAGDKALWIAFAMPNPTPDAYESQANEGKHTLFHPMDKVEHTLGCVGLDYMFDSRFGFIGSSGYCIKQFYAKVMSAAVAGELWCEVVIS